MGKLNEIVDGVKSKVKEVVPNLQEALEKSVPSDKAAKEAMIKMLESKLNDLKSAK